MLTRNWNVHFFLSGSCLLGGFNLSAALSLSALSEFLPSTDNSQQLHVRLVLAIILIRLAAL